MNKMIRKKLREKKKLDGPLMKHIYRISIQKHMLFEDRTALWSEWVFLTRVLFVQRQIS